MAKKNEKGNRGFLTFLLGLTFFLILLLVLNRGVFLSLLGAIAGFILGGILFKKKKNAELVEGVSGVTQEMYEQTLAEAKIKYRKLRSYELKITDLDLRNLLVNVNELVKKIIDDVKKDPRDIKTARRFFSYYLDAQITILQKYMDITTHHGGEDSTEETGEKVKITLTSMEEAYGTLLKKMLENDVLQLDTELDVLDQTIRMEGLIDGKSEK